MSAPLRRRMNTEKERALEETPRPFRIYGDYTEESRRTNRRGMKDTTPRGTAHSTRRSEPKLSELIPPAPTPEALSSPARLRAERDGFAQFGKRTWFLVERGGAFRAVESLDDAPGWSLVKEMKR